MTTPEETQTPEARKLRQLQSYGLSTAEADPLVKIPATAILLSRMRSDASLIAELRAKLDEQERVIDELARVAGRIMRYGQGVGQLTHIAAEAKAALAALSATPTRESEG